MYFIIYIFNKSDKIHLLEKKTKLLSQEKELIREKHSLLNILNKYNSGDIQSTSDKLQEEIKSFMSASNIYKGYCSKLSDQLISIKKKLNDILDKSK